MEDYLRKDLSLTFGRTGAAQAAPRAACPAARRLKSAPAALHRLKEGCEASTHPPSTVHHRHGPEVPAK